MINLSTMITRIHRQLRLSPLVQESDIVQWLSEAVKHISPRCVLLTTWVVIPAKEDTQRYLLPANHISTIGAYYDGVRLQTCNSLDAELVSPGVPVFFHDDEWQDEASTAEASEFAIHYTLNELWPLQLMKSQNAYGRKTTTLVDAPASDGEGFHTIFGVLDGTITHTADTISWPTYIGGSYYIASSDDNIFLIYKYVDRLPVSTTDEAEWSDLMGVLYTLQSCSIALSTEDDEYDRFTAWLYGYVCDSVTSMLRSISITRQFV